MVEGLEPRHRKSNPRFASLLLAALIGGLIGGAVVFIAVQLTNQSTSFEVSEPTSFIPLTLDVNTSITDAVVEVGPSVVTVINHLPPRRTFFGTTSELTSSGSGVIISEDGHIVTNNHVVQGAESLEIILADGSVHPAELVGVDPYADLAVVQTKGEIQSIAAWGNSDSLKRGEAVIAIGSPLGDFKNTVTVGVVSATERNIDVDQDYQLEGLIQTDAAINQGNSGGPLVNLAGQIIGINTLIVRGGGGGSAVAEGLGFAIPSNAARAIVSQIVQKGYVSRPHLGARWGWITPAVASRFRLPVEYGVFLTEIIQGGPVDRAGLQHGDILISINGEAFDDDHPFINMLFEHEPGEIVTFVVVRDSTEFDVDVELSEQASG
jgi:2-alkenal reductase